MRNGTAPQVQIAHAVIIFIAGSVLGAILEQALTAFIFPVQSLTIFVIFICLVVMSYMVSQVAKHIDELRHNVGLRIVYFDRDRHGRAALFSEARKVVEKAKHTIFVLNSVITEVSEEDEEKDETVLQERDRYYETLLDRAINGVTYERVIQLKKGQSVAKSIKDKGYIRHFHRIFEVKDENQRAPIGLIKAPARRLSTFVLIDDETLIWQINEILESGDMQMNGIFIIQDPRHEITQHFRAFAESAKRESLGAVQRSELPPLDDGSSQKRHAG
jgi:hypothetical protein